MTHPLVEISILHFKTSNCCLGLVSNFSYEAFNAKGYVFLFDLFVLLWVGNIRRKKLTCIRFLSAIIFIVLIF